MATCSVAIPRTRGGRQLAFTPESLPACPHPVRASAELGRGAGQAFSRSLTSKNRDFLQQRTSRGCPDPWESSASRTSQPCSCTRVGLMLKRAFFMKKKKKNMRVFLQVAFFEGKTKRKKREKSSRTGVCLQNCGVGQWPRATHPPWSFSSPEPSKGPEGSISAPSGQAPAGRKLLWVLTVPCRINQSS